MARPPVANSVPKPTARGDFVVSLTIALSIAVSESVVAWTVLSLTGYTIHLLGFCVVVLTALFGVRARFGTTLGALVVGALGGSVAAGATASLAGFVGVTVCARLMDRPVRQTARWVGHCLGVTLVTVVAVAATSGFLAELFGLASYSVWAFRWFQTTLPFAVAGVPAVWLLARYEQIPIVRSPHPTSSDERRYTAGIVLLWGGGGFAMSFISQALDVVPAAFIGRRLSPTIETLYTLTQGGHHLQLLGGMAALLALAFVSKSE